jgi:hypothetical protein
MRFSVSQRVFVALLLCSQIAIATATAAETKKSAVAPAPATPAVRPGTIYRMNQLEEAKIKAITEQKPIAWIASFPEHLTPAKDLMIEGSHSATSYAIRALQSDTIIVFSDGRLENHQEPPIVDQALHTPEPHYTVPGVIILTPALDKVIYKMPMTAAVPQDRVRLYTEALKKIRDKSSW